MIPQHAIRYIDVYRIIVLRTILIITYYYNISSSWCSMVVSKSTCILSSFVCENDARFLWAGPGLQHKTDYKIAAWIPVAHPSAPGSPPAFQVFDFRIDDQVLPTRKKAVRRTGSLHLENKDLAKQKDPVVIDNHKAGKVGVASSSGTAFLYNPFHDNFCNATGLMKDWFPRNRISQEHLPSYFSHRHSVDCGKKYWELI